MSETDEDSRVLLFHFNIRMPVIIERRACDLYQPLQAFKKVKVEQEFSFTAAIMEEDEDAAPPPLDGSLIQASI